MNGILPAKALEEIGQSGIALTEKLLGHVGADEIDYRFGPSLIVRSESELLGFSDPRFCVRAYLKRGGEDLGFLNLRRITRLESRFESRFPESRNQSEKIAKPFADCVIGAAPDLRERFRVLDAPLWRANGETLPGESDIRATPFVQHIQMCGGMCAQAAAFMVTSLLLEHEKGIHGISEITYHAAGLVESEDEQYLKIGGLEIPAIVRYFNFVGFNAPLNLAPSPDDLPEDGYEPSTPLSDGEQRSARLFQRGMEAYISSGFPVVLPVDIALLERSGAYDRNGWSHDIECEPGHQATHAVVAVGCSKKTQHDTFLINDPATAPFLKINAESLYSSGIFLPKPGADLSKPIPKEDFRFFTGLFIPVVPSRVTTSFLNSPSGDRSPLIDRLEFRLDWARWRFEEQEWRPEIVEAAAFDIYSERYSRLRLVRLDQFRSLSFVKNRKAPMWRRFQQQSASLAEKLQELKEWEADQWVWVDHTGDLIWIYDAELSEEDARELIKGKSPCDALLIYDRPSADEDELSGKWKVHEAANVPSTSEVSAAGKDSLPPEETDTTTDEPADTREKKKEKIERPPANLKALKPSLVTSFCVGGFETAFSSAWPRDEIGAELYAFMHGDFDNLSPNDGGPTWRSVRRLAGLGPEIGPITEKIIDAAKGRKIHALASFVPEISNPMPDPKQDGDHDDGGDENSPTQTWSAARDTYGRDALEVLIQLAGALREGGQQDLRIIEAVAGSRISKIESTVEEDLEILEATLRPTREILRTLLKNLLPLASAIKEAGVTIALELEPGPLYGLSGPNSLRQFCEIIEEKEFEPLQNLVGFNLDIAHWGLIRKIKPDEIEDDPDIFSRIIHAHISDHDRAHFADCPIGAIHKDECFRRWLELYARRYEANGDFDMKCTGVVSVELEACRDVESRDCSVEKLLGLLDQK